MSPAFIIPVARSLAKLPIASSQPIRYLAAKASARTNQQPSENMSLKEGDTLPNVEVFDGDVSKKVKVLDLFKGKKGILFAVPGAFTPGCSQKHLPSYVKQFDKLKSKGVEVIACLAVNDPFVVASWGKEHEVGDKIHMLADPEGNFTKAVGLELQGNPVLGNTRSKRYSAIVENGVVKKLNVEPDGTGTTCSIADAIIKDL